MNFLKLETARDVKGENYMFKSIKSKLIASFLISITMCIAVMSIVMSQVASRTIKNDFILSTKNEMTKVEEIVNGFFTEMKNNGEMLSQNEIVKRADNSITSYMDLNDPLGAIVSNPLANGGLEVELYRVYENFAKSHPITADVYFGTTGGSYVQYPKGTIVNGYDPRVRPWYKKAMENPGEVMVTDAYYWAGADAAHVSIVKTVDGNNGEIIGVQAIDIALSELTNMLSKLKIGQSGYVVIVEDTGVILSHSKKPELNFLNIKDTYLKDYSEKQEGTIEYTDDNETFITNIYTSKENGWKYISVVPKLELVKKIKFINISILLLGIAVIIISIIVSTLISKDISRPIKNIRDLMKQVENGNFNAKSHIKGEDELAQLSNSFNNMTENVKMLIQNSKNTSEDINNLADLLNQMSDQVTFAAEEMTSAISGLATETYDQARQTNGIVDSINQITDEIGSISYRMDAKIDEVKEFVGPGLGISEQVTNTIEEIRLESIKLKKSLEKIDYEKEQAEDVVYKISSSSDQAMVTSEEITALSEEQTSSIYKLTDLIKDLRYLSDELKGSISKFNI